MEYILRLAEGMYNHTPFVVRERNYAKILRVCMDKGYTPYRDAFGNELLTYKGAQATFQITRLQPCNYAKIIATLCSGNWTDLSLCDGLTINSESIDFDCITISVVKQTVHYMEDSESYDSVYETIRELCFVIKLGTKQKFITKLKKRGFTDSITDADLMYVQR